MPKQTIALLILSVCSFAANAAVLTINNHTNTTFSYSTSPDFTHCFTIIPSDETFQEMPKKKAHFFYLSGCHGPAIAEVTFNDKGIESVDDFPHMFTFYGSGYVLNIT